MSQYKPTKVSGDSIQAVIEVYKKDVDRTMIRQLLQLTVEERLLNLENFVKFAGELQAAGKLLQNNVSTEKRNESQLPKANSHSGQGKC